MASAPALFAPLALGPLALKNRVCLSAVWMGRGDRATGEPLPSLVSHYASVAQGGCGLLVVEHTAVSPEGLADERMLRLYTDEHTGFHRRIADAVHATPGALALVQLNDAGAAGVHPARHAPSPLDLPDGVHVGGMDALAIRRVRESFAAAAGRARAAGYDGVQVHSAHGYLLSSFLSPCTNRRADEYGGSLANRARLLLEVCRAIREEQGRGFALAVKINCNDFAGADGVQPEEVGWVCRQLEGVADFVELSGGTPFGRHATIRPGVFHKDPATEVWYARELATIARMTALPLCVVGGVRSPAGAARALEAGATLVSMGRPFIRHQAVVGLWAAGTPYTPCISCNQCIRRALGGAPVRCWVPYGPGEASPYEGEDGARPGGDRLD